MNMRSTNTGVTVRINLWALPNLKGFDSLKARMWIRGKMTNAQTGKSKMFNNAGELLLTLGNWNADKFKELKKQRRISN
jgi:hypothetical protein